QLDERSLLNVAKVSRRWQSVCRDDSRLKQTARSYLHREKRRLYGVTMTKNKPKKAKTSNMTTENAMKFTRASSKVAKAPPATFRFGPSGISSGLLVNQQIRRDFGPRKSAAPMRSMTRLSDKDLQGILSTSRRSCNSFDNMFLGNILHKKTRRPVDIGQELSSDNPHAFTHDIEDMEDDEAN
ncbi:hypothetical protein PV326_011887, partial [Microctonus aethiopoides]